MRLELLAAYCSGWLTSQNPLSWFAALKLTQGRKACEITLSQDFIHSLYLSGKAAYFQKISFIELLYLG